MLRLLAATLALAFSLTSASAAPRYHAHRHDVDGYTRQAQMTMDRDGRYIPAIERSREVAPRPHYRARGRVSRTAAVRHGPARFIRQALAPVAAVARVAKGILGTVAGGVAAIVKGDSLAGLPAELVAKVTEIAQSCPGMRPISTFRPGARVAGTRIQSLHAVHRAADIAGGDFNCAYAHLQGWPGGASIDRLAGGPVTDHIHLSYSPGSSEWGARFCHLGACGTHARRGGGHRVARHWRARRA